MQDDKPTAPNGDGRPGATHGSLEPTSKALDRLAREYRQRHHDERKEEQR